MFVYLIAVIKLQANKRCHRRMKKGGPGGHGPPNNLLLMYEQPKTTFIVESTITLAPPTIDCFLRQWL